MQRIWFERGSPWLNSFRFKRSCWHCHPDTALDANRNVAVETLGLGLGTPASVGQRCFNAPGQQSRRSALDREPLQSMHWPARQGRSRGLPVDAPFEGNLVAAPRCGHASRVVPQGRGLRRGEKRVLRHSAPSECSAVLSRVGPAALRSCGPMLCLTLWRTLLCDLCFMDDLASLASRTISQRLSRIVVIRPVRLMST